MEKEEILADLEEKLEEYPEVYQNIALADVDSE
jgi:hypothetical protein